MRKKQEFSIKKRIILFFMLVAFLFVAWFLYITIHEGMHKVMNEQFCNIDSEVHIFSVTPYTTFNVGEDKGKTECLNSIIPYHRGIELIDYGIIVFFIMLITLIIAKRYFIIIFRRW